MFQFFKKLKYKNSYLFKSVVETVRSSLDISLIKKEIVEVVGKSLSADRCFIVEYDEQNDKFLLVDRDDTALAATMAFLKGRTKPNDVLIDIHFNAGPATAKGTEVLIPAKYTKEELEIADRISDIFGNVLGTPERGSKAHTDGVKDETDSNRGSLGWMKLSGYNILIEVEFLSNPEAMKVYDAKKEECWKLTAEYLVGLLKQSIK